MTVRFFKTLLANQPFEPFRLVMSSGREYEVRHPEVAELTRTNMFVEVDSSSPGPPRYMVCSLLHVSPVEPLGETGLSGPAPPPKSDDDVDGIAA